MIQPTYTVAPCPSCAAHVAREKELEEERDRWYGAAQERQIKVNGLESTCRVQGQLIAEQRNNIVDLKQQVSNLEEYMLKGVAFRDELQAQLDLALAYGVSEHNACVELEGDLKLCVEYLHKRGIDIVDLRRSSNEHSR
jgi:hypothetical protein